MEILQKNIKNDSEDIIEKDDDEEDDEIDIEDEDFGDFGNMRLTIMQSYTDGMKLLEKMKAEGTLRNHLEKIEKEYSERFERIVRNQLKREGLSENDGLVANIESSVRAMLFDELCPAEWIANDESEDEEYEEKDVLQIELYNASDLVKLEGTKEEIFRADDYRDYFLYFFKGYYDIMELEWQEKVLDIFLNEKDAKYWITNFEKFDGDFYDFAESVKADTLGSETK